VKIRVVITGRGYHTSLHLPDELTLADGSTVDDALAKLATLLPAGEQFPDSCLVAVADQHLGTLALHASRELRDGDELTLIAPMAGG
jgi:molybdopterin converting factor small subunit